MDIYHIPEAGAGERWQSTRSKTYAIQQANNIKLISKVTVARDGREGMCATLNKAELEIAERCNLQKGIGQHEEDDYLEQPEEQPKPAVRFKRIDKPASTPLVQQAFTAMQIEDFILNHASVAQAGNILACLGTRFAELVKEHVHD